MSTEQLDSIKENVKTQVGRMNKLTEGTPYGTIEAVPDHDIFADIIKECKDSEFWTNFREISPVLLCFATETDPAVSRERDLCVTGEILKTKSLLEAIQKKLGDSAAADLNLPDISVAVKTLTDKVDVITYLKEPDSDPAELRFKLSGTNKMVKVDIKKLQEAIKFVDDDGSEETKTVTPTPEPVKVELSKEEDEFIDDKLKSFDLRTGTTGIIDKKCMMKLMKIIGDFSKFKSSDISKKAQTTRLAYYGKDNEKYVDVILETMSKEEESFNTCTSAVLDKISVTHDTYMRSEQALIMDPMSQVELLQKGIESEEGSAEVPDSLDKATTIKILKESNDKSFEDYKSYSEAVKKKDPYLTPVVIS